MVTEEDGSFNASQLLPPVPTPHQPPGLGEAQSTFELRSLEEASGCLCTGRRISNHVLDGKMIFSFCPSCFGYQLVLDFYGGEVVTEVDHPAIKLAAVGALFSRLKCGVQEYALPNSIEDWQSVLPDKISITNIEVIEATERLIGEVMRIMPASRIFR